MKQISIKLTNNSPAVHVSIVSHVNPSGTIANASSIAPAKQQLSNTQKAHRCRCPSLALCPLVRSIRKAHHLGAKLRRAQKTSLKHQAMKP